MFKIALKMLFGDRAKFLGMIFGVTFASLVITQQMSIFVGLLTRTFGFLTDTPTPDLWVMDPKVQFVDDIKPLQDTQILRVRGVEGVQWALPLYKGQLRARLPDGTFQTCNVIGIDDATLIGGPPRIVQGTLADLRRSDSVIIDTVGAKGKLAKPGPTPDSPKIPLKLGEVLELNDNRAIVVGFAEVTRTFQSQPVIYTTYSRATQFAPRERKLLSYILVKAKEGVDKNELAKKIQETTGLSAYSKDEFTEKTLTYFMKYTGIPINFGIAVLLGFIIGTAIVGQTFFNFTIDNLRYFGTLKAMGAKTSVLLKMIILQAVVVGAIGYGLGVGAASMFFYVSKNSELAFRLLWQLLAISGTAIAVICILSALISMIKVIRLEPAVVFKG